MISTVNANTVSQPGQNSATSSKIDVMGKDDFLNLLVTQLKYQDPLNPTDSADFTAQLAQFSSLEQLENVNTNLELLGDAYGNMNNSQAISYIGKIVNSLGNSISLKGEDIDDIQYNLSADADVVYANIYDEAGNMVKTLKETSVSAGKNTITWDGKDNDGNMMSDGVYNFEVFGYDQKQRSVDLTAYTENRITGVAYLNGEPYLSSGELSIPLSSVFQVTDDAQM